LAGVAAHEIVKASQAVFFVELAKESNHNVLVDSMCVDHHTFGVFKSCVVLKGSAVHADLFAHLCDCVFVIVCAHVQLEDSFGYVWIALKVDLEKFSLEMTFVSQISF
jgi:hypothetical protein